MSSQPTVPDDTASAQEERKWNLLGDQMSFFHEQFKQDCVSPHIAD
jgi:hypothetical protein